MKNGFSLGSSQQAKARRPDGFSACRRLAKESVGSAKNITPKRETRRSKLAGSNGYTVASASTKSTGRPAGAVWRARASIGPEMSMPITCPLEPTSGPSATEMAPLPQPTSTMRSPAAGLARSIRRSAIGAKRTSCDRWRSAQRWPPGPFQ
jgi:hypothetical protein